MDPLYRMKHRVDRLLIADKLRQGYLRKCIFDDLMQADDDRPDAAAAFVHARIEHAGIALTMRAQNIFVEHLDYLAEMDLARGPSKLITAFCASGRMDKTSLVQKPHQLSCVGRRNALALGYLRQRKALTYRQCRELYQASEPVFLLC